VNPHLFLDESKQNGYVVAVAIVAADDLAYLRKRFGR
jgi:hypothetical protein